MTGNGTTLFVPAGSVPPGRMDWVDYAKGICIVMVVMLHSVAGVEKATGQTGFMHEVVAFAYPFRMPDFFLISGLFLSRVIERDWRTYLDRKIVHFAYFYVLWMTIQLAFKAPVFAADMGWAGVVRLYLLSFIDPFGTLWFIYLLPVFFVFTKVTRRVPPALIWVIAAALEMAHVQTGWMVIDEFAARFVYFYSGYLFADAVFRLSDTARARPAMAVVALLIWALANGMLVELGLSTWPLISLLLGFSGACAIITIGTLLARRGWLDFVRYLGEHSIVVYLAFFLPMAATRVLLLKSGLIQDVGVISAIVTIAGVGGAVLIWWACRGTRLSFLFERPDAFWIAPKSPTAARLQPAE